MKLVTPFLLLVLGCASSGASNIERTAPVATLTVTNDRFYDAAVFIVHDGGKGRRLDGYVTGNSTRVFALTASDLTHGTLQLFAKYVADGMTVLSAEVTAVEGVNYTWRLGPQRGQEFLAPIRSADDGEVALGLPIGKPDSVRVCHAPSCRSSGVARRFMRLTGHPRGWPGHIVDHWQPLECGGADAVENLWWQTTAEAAAKDRLETQCARWLPAQRSDGKPVPHDSIP